MPRALPPLFALFALLTLPLSHAAPVPKNSVGAKIEKAFGKIVDAKGDSHFALEGDALTITLPANEVRDLTEKIDTAPRVEREVKGDFVLTVTVSAPLDGRTGLAPEMRSVNDVYPFVGGGVQFKSSDDHWHCLGLSRWVADDEVKSGFGSVSPGDPSPKPYGSFEHNGVMAIPQANPSSLTFQFTRRSRDIAVVCFLDGKQMDGRWTAQSTLADGTAPITVALYAQHGSNRMHTVTFSGYSIEPLKDEKK